MTEKKDDTTLSPAMRSALQAVARMKGDSVILGADLLAVGDHDDRFASVVEPNAQQGWKPAGR